MDLLLSEFLQKNQKIKIAQPKNLFYNIYRNRIRLQFTENRTTRRCQHELLYLMDNQDAVDEIITRAENRRLSIFYNNDATFQSILDALHKIKIENKRTAEDFIYEVTYDQLNLARKTLHVPTIKKRGFNYKITLQTGWNKFNVESKRRLHDILAQQWSDFRLTESTYRWLLNKETSNWAGKYFYAKEGAMVTFIQLGCSDLVDQVYEII